VVDAVEDTGAVTYLHTTAKVGQEAVQVAVRAPGRQAYGKGEQVRVSVDPHSVHVFSAKTELRLPGDDAPA
jgi:multiple sugar transport system ATP-binding protein